MPVASTSLLEEIEEVLPIKSLQNNTPLPISSTLTCVSAVVLVSLVHAVKDPIAAERVGFAASFVTLKAKLTTVVVRRGNGVVLDAVPLIGLKFHAVRTATDAIEARSWETEVAATAIG